VALTKKKKILSSFQPGLRENKQANKQTKPPTTRRKGKNNASVANSQFGTTEKLLILDALPFAALVQLFMKG